MQKLTPHSKLFSESWNLYKKNWMNWGLILLVPLILNLIVTFTGGLWLISNWVLLIVLIIALGIVQMWAELTLLIAIAGNSKQMNVMDAYKKSWPKLWAFFGLTVLLFLVLLGAFALLIVPGIILAVFLCFAVWSLVDEDERSMNALLRSKHLVKGYWWPVFGRLFVMGLLVGLFQAIVSAILDGIGVPYADQITNAILAFTAGPLAACFAFLLYKNLKSVKGSTKVTTTSGEKNGLIALAVLGFIAPVIVIAAGILLFASTASETFLDDPFLDSLEYEITDEFQTDMGMDAMTKEERKEYLRGLMGQ